MKNLFLALAFISLPSLLLAQDTKFQIKTVVHSTVPVQPGWFGAGWSITNFRQEAPDNTNIMVGIGRKFQSGWVEVMLQRQYALHTNQWFIDTRFFRRLDKHTTLFVEAAPFLERRAVFCFVRVERRIGPINLIVESENTVQSGVDSVGVGPGISLPARKILGKLKFSPGIVWQWRPRDTHTHKQGDQDPNFLRLYLSFPF